MSTASTIRHRRFPGSAVGTAIVTVILVCGVAALGLALSQHGSAGPVSPTTECTLTSCGAGDHPVLPGRHDLRKHAGRVFRPTPLATPAPPAPSGTQGALGRP